MNTMEIVAAEGDPGAGLRTNRAAGRVVLRPRSRRRARERIAIAATMLAGIMLLTVAVASGDDALEAGGTALAGTVTLALAAAAVAETVPRRAVGTAMLVAAFALALSVLPASAIDALEVARLTAAGLLLIAGLALLSATPARS